MFNRSDIRLGSPERRNMAPNIVSKMYTKLYLTSIHHLVATILWTMLLTIGKEHYVIISLMSLVHIVDLLTKLKGLQLLLVKYCIFVIQIKIKQIWTTCISMSNAFL